jgi:hypothetical protein
METPAQETTKSVPAHHLKPHPSQILLFGKVFCIEFYPYFDSLM